jgi:putative membrane protein
MRSSIIGLIVAPFVIAACATPSGVTSSPATGSTNRSPRIAADAVPPPAGPGQVLEAPLPVPNDTSSQGPAAYVPLPSQPVYEAAPPESIDDEKILGLTHVANENEHDQLDQARLAALRARDDRVRELARSIVREHTKVDREARRLAQIGKLNPHDSELATKLRDDGRQKLDQLGDKQGDAFDRAYVDTVVQGHQHVLQIIDQRLLPNATNVDVKALVEDLRPGVQKNYDQAKALQLKLEK